MDKITDLTTIYGLMTDHSSVLTAAIWNDLMLSIQAYINNTINNINTINNGVNDINIDKLYPLESGYYTLTTAISAVTDNIYKKPGAVIIFLSNINTIERWLFTNSDIANWNDIEQWSSSKEGTSIRYVKNNTGADIARGKLVYVNGSTGENPLISLSTNTNYDIAQRTWGITYDAINKNAIGRIMHFGMINNIDTSAFTAGTELWLDIDGGMTSTRPASPTAQIFIGFVIRQSNTEGSIFIDFRHLPKTTSLSDVKNETYVDGDVPVFNATNGRFEKQNLVSSIASKQNTLTFDDAPTDGSVNPVKSGGVKSYVDNKISSLAIEDLVTYGVEWDSAVRSPDGTRIGNPSLHRTLPVHNLMKGVLLADDGTENLLLNDSSWIGQTRDGSMGQVMVKIPNYYFKCEKDGTKFRFKISTTKLAGYNTFFDESIPYVYCSAYEAGLDRTNNKLVSIVNNGPQYRGGDNTSAWDGTYRSLLGMPAINIGRANFRTYARNRNGNANANWNEYIYTIHVMIAWLFYTEYATLNSQKDYNAVLDSNGYKQGGLGLGVSSIPDQPDWGEYNGYNPIIPMGTTDTLGNNTGVIAHNVLSSDGVSVYYSAPVPRYRGIENPFGHLWKWSDGINIKYDGTTITVYITTHPSVFSDSSYDNYENRGTISQSADWINQMLLGSFADLLPLTVGGSSSTYWCDYYSDNTATNFYGALLGGTAYDGVAAGFGRVGTSDFTLPMYAGIGSRLCFVKQA